MTPDAGRLDAAEADGAEHGPTEPTTGDRRVSARAALAALLAVGLFAVGVAVALRPGPTAAAIRSALADLGPYAPLAFVLLQAAQVVVAPVPGQLLTGVGGYLFGGLWGTVLSLLGVVLGSVVVYGLARRYGAPAMERFLGEGLGSRVERFGERNGPLALFAFFLLPVFPDDLLCAVAGVWNVRPRTFLVLLLVGRTPSFVVVAYAGTSVQRGALERFGLLVGAVAVACLGVYLLRDRIERRLGPDPTAGDRPDQ